MLEGANIDELGEDKYVVLEVGFYSGGVDLLEFLEFGM